MTSTSTKTAKKIGNTTKAIIGWEEWCIFPDLQLPAIKAKVDTGAKTSCIHAYAIKAFNKDGVKYVRFKINPLQRNKTLVCTCEAPLSDFRVVISSNGEREKRYVIKTPLNIGDKMIEAEVTLTSRHAMTFRMLLGRDAIRKAKLVVDPAKSCVFGKITSADKLYEPKTGDLSS
jgi:ribosomal protein S6--L-glutamate ligase